MTNKPLKGKLIAVIGFGNVGKSVCKFLSDWGADIIVADVDESKIKGFPIIPLKDVFREREIDILIPCAVSDIINEKNWKQINAKIIIEGGNCQIAEGIKPKLRKKGIRVIDDYIASAGGVIASHCELKGLTKKQAFKIIRKKME